jgi:ribosomal protein S18 acetylase RimI-like enzyme
MIYRTPKKSESAIFTQIHLVAFKDFFLTTLGKRFLNTYYSASLKSTDSISICAVDENDQIVGFSIGCIQAKGFHKRLVLQNFLQFLFQGIIILMTNPIALWRLANNMEKNKMNNDDGNYAELLSIAVSPDAKGSGIGKEMIAHFEAKAKSRGCNKIALTTDYYKNNDVIAFYKRSGYEVFYEFTTYPNRRMYKMTKELK